MAYKIQYGNKPTRKKIPPRIFPVLLLALALIARLLYPQLVTTMQDLLFPPQTVQAFSQLLAEEAYFGEAVTVFCDEIFNSAP